MPRTRYRPAPPVIRTPEVTVRQDTETKRWLVAYEPLTGRPQLLGDFATSEGAKDRADELVANYPGARRVLYPPSGGWKAMGFLEVD